MKFDVSPRQGVNDILFGMTQRQVRGLVDNEPTPFMKGPDAPHETDYFKQEHMFAFYAADGRLEALEFSIEAELMLNNMVLTSMSYQKAQEFLQAMDPDTEADGYGITSNALGISFYFPFGEEDPSEPLETVIVFRDGYYENAGS